MAAGQLYNKVGQAVYNKIWLDNLIDMPGWLSVSQSYKQCSWCSQNEL